MMGEDVPHGTLGHFIQFVLCAEEALTLTLTSYCALLKLVELALDKTQHQTRLAHCRLS